MAERRISKRQRSFLQGRIFFNNRRSSVDCLVRDISDTGAKLVFSDAIAVPDVVELNIPNKAETHRARVQWREGEEVGVSFVPEEISPSLVPAPAAAPDLVGRISRLEQEVASLHRKVSELQQELQLKGSSII
jgi:hypothetical protein